jgi:NADH-quinone oxidoreductase subunit E
MDKLARGEKIEPGSAIGRQTSAPEGAQHTLTDASLYDGSLAKPIALPNAPEKA